MATWCKLRSVEGHYRYYYYGSKSLRTYCVQTVSSVRLLRQLCAGVNNTVAGLVGAPVGCKCHTCVIACPHFRKFEPPDRRRGSRLVDAVCRAGRHWCLLVPARASGLHSYRQVGLDLRSSLDYFLAPTKLLRGSHRGKQRSRDSNVGEGTQVARRPCAFGLATAVVSEREEEDPLRSSVAYGRPRCVRASRAASMLCRV